MICEFVRSSMQVDWKICRMFVCACLWRASASAISSIHSFYVSKIKKRPSAYLVGVLRIKTMNCRVMCWSCVKQKRKITVWFMRFVHTHVRSHTFRSVESSARQLPLCTDKCILRRIVHVHVHVQVCDYVWEVNAIMLCYQVCMLLSAASPFINSFSQTGRGNLRALSFISMPIYLAYFACCVCLHLKSIILTMVNSFVPSESKALQVKIAHLHCV